MSIPQMTQKIRVRLDQNLHYPEHKGWWENKFNDSIGKHTSYKIYRHWRTLQEMVIYKIPDYKTGDKHLCEMTHKHMYEPCYIDQTGYNPNQYYEKIVLLAWLKLQGTSGYLPFDENPNPFSASQLKEAPFAETIKNDLQNQIADLIQQFDSTFFEEKKMSI